MNKQLTRILILLTALCLGLLILAFMYIGAKEKQGATSSSGGSSVVGESGEQGGGSSDPNKAGMQIQPEDEMTQEEIEEAFKAQWSNTEVNSDGATVVLDDFTATEITMDDIQALEGFPEYVDGVVASNSPQTAFIDGVVYAILPGQGEITYQCTQTLDGALEIRYQVKISDEPNVHNVRVLKLEFTTEKPLPIFFTDINKKLVDTEISDMLYTVYKNGVGIFCLQELPAEMSRQMNVKLLAHEQFMGESPGMYTIDVVDGEISVYSRIDTYVARGKFYKDSNGMTRLITSSSEVLVTLKTDEYDPAVQYDVLLRSSLNELTAEII